MNRAACLSFLIAIALSGSALADDTVFWCLGRDGIKRIRNYPCGGDEREVKSMNFIVIRHAERPINRSSAAATQINQPPFYDKAMGFAKGGKDEFERAAWRMVEQAKAAAATGNPDNATARFNAALGAPPPTIPRSAINTQTGEVYPGVAGGIVNPRNGQFYPEVAGGYINPATGQFMPKQ